jgi:hypothetical protein
LSACQDICCATYEQCTFAIVPRWMGSGGCCFRHGEWRYNMSMTIQRVGAKISLLKRGLLMASESWIHK